MPPLPPAAGIVLVRCKGTYGGQPFNNIFHLQYTGTAPTNADLSTVATSVSTAWGTNIAPVCFTNVILTGIDLADLTTTTSAVATSTFNIPGTRAGTTLTAATACVVSWTIARRYRGGHPRTYFPAGVYSDVGTTRSWLGAFITAMNNGATAFRVALNAISVSGATYKMVSVSYFLQHALRPTPAPFLIQGNVTHGRIDTQRRRLGKEIP